MYLRTGTFQSGEIITTRPLSGHSGLDFPGRVRRQCSSGKEEEMKLVIAGVKDGYGIIRKLSFF